MFKLLLPGAVAAALAGWAFTRINQPAQYEWEPPTVGGQKMPTVISTIKPKLDHFEPSEFREWYKYMNPGTLRALDHFRTLWGDKVTVSPHPAGLGRHLGPDDTSQHNIDRWGDVRAVDFFPKGLTRQNAQFAKECAQKAGFSGIGIYLDTQPGPMMHGDTRPDRSATYPATWARVNHKYVGINEAIA